MKKSLISLLFLAACGSPEKPAATPQDHLSAAPSNAPKVEETSLAEVGLDPSAIDRSADPCDDFYQFACGGWLKSTDIPPEYSRYGRFTEIHERNQARLKNILEKASSTDDAANPEMQKLGAYYGACMDEAAVEKNGLSAIEPLLKEARGIKSRADLDAAIRHLHEHGIWPLFHVGAEPDFANATQVIAIVGQDGLGLPDRDYYLSDDPSSPPSATPTRARRAYVRARRQPKAAAKRAADDVLSLETKLAKASKTKSSFAIPRDLQPGRPRWPHKP